MNARVVLQPDNVEEVIRLLYAKQVKNIDNSNNVETNSAVNKWKEAQCSCINYNCGCCAHVTVPKIKLDDTCCVNVSYLPAEYGISVTFTFDGISIINATVSAKNPPPICFGIPYLEKEASVCIRFYNLDYTERLISGCVRLEARLAFVLVESVDLGCFHLPIPGGPMAEQGAAALVAALKQSDTVYGIK
jgi:hypothetical protein